MNTRHGGKLLAALMTAVFTSGANAAIDADQIVFYAYNGSTDSVMFDLGVNLSNFLPTNNSTIVWNLASSTVTATTPGGSTVSYSNVWAGSGFTFDSTSRWGVIGANAESGDLVTTSLAPIATLNTFPGAGMGQVAVDVPGVYMRQNNFLGNHQAVANGANRAVGGNALHFNGFGAFDNWQNQAPFSSGRAGSGALPFYYITYADDFGTATRYSNRFTFDASTATLTYGPAVVGEIPEPSAWGLVAAGALGLVGFARRRKPA